MLRLWLSLLLLLTPSRWNQLTFSYAQTTDSLDPLIQEVFGLFNETTSDKSAGCNCVSLNQCRKYNNSEINTTGEGLIDIRIGQCPESLQVCCDEKIDTNTPKPTPPFKRTAKCGFRNENGVGFRVTVGNSESQFGEFPWMIALLTRKTVNKTVEVGRYNCGGSLIHPKVVLTAAHCVISYEKKPDTVILRAGEWDSTSEGETVPFQERTAEKIIVHKDYKSGPLYNDIALIILKEAFKFAENVDVVCLPEPNENVDNQNCVASGWGKDNFGEEGVYQNILKRVDLPIVPRKECHKKLTETRLGPKYILHESVLCAGGIPNQDTCKGDGGGPLMCPIQSNKEHYQQVGIVSWGIGCGNNIPAVYVNVPYFRYWIDEQFIENNIELYYQNEKNELLSA